MHKHISKPKKLSEKDWATPYGEIEYNLNYAPLSKQSRKGERDKFVNLVKQKTRKAKYLISGDVEVQVEWMIHEKLRYECDSTPDVDNILKLILDALSGPDGIIINDCQVQCVTSYWIDSMSPEQRILIRIKMHSPDDYVRKDGLFFIHFGNGLCFPFNRNCPGLNLLIDCVQNSLSLRTQLEESTKDYYASKCIMPIQRFFHRTRVTPFEVIEIQQMNEFLQNKKNKDKIEN